VSLAWRLLGCAVAIIWLHALSVVPMLYDHGQWPDALRAVQPDLLVLLLIAAIGGAVRRPKLASHLAAMLLLMGLVTRLTTVIVRINFQRDFELSDFLLFGGLYHALTNAAEAWQVWLGGAVTIVTVLLLQWSTARAFRSAATICQRQRPAAASMALLGITALLATTWAVAPSHPSMLLRLAKSVTSATQIWLNPQSVLAPIEQRIAVGSKRMAEVPSNLELLNSADVHVLVLESYGRLMFRHPELHASIKTLFADLQQPLRAAGFQSRTSACAPAIAGGLSGLAHAELLTGVVVPDERTRDMLLSSSLVTFPHRFLQAGYHTVEVQPAMPRAWPEGEAFYGIEESIWQQQLAYRGSKFGFGRMPDQYSLHYLLDQVIRPAKQPVFSMFVGVSGHAPWSSVPPYVAHWPSHEQVYQQGPANKYDIGYTNMQRNPAALAAYGEAIRYTLRAAVDFTCQLRRPSLVIVLGDHQPPIASSVQPADRTHDVPVHVLSNQPELLARLAAVGFVAGLHLPADVKAMPMADLAPKLLQAFSK
jgi:hypothetical protein